MACDGQATMEGVTFLVSYAAWDRLQPTQIPPNTHTYTHSPMALTRRPARKRTVNNQHTYSEIEKWRISLYVIERAQFFVLLI